MTRSGWIFAGSTAALAGAFALSLAQTPTVTAPQAAIVTPDPVSAPALAAAPAAAPVAVAKPRTIAPVAKRAATPVSGIVPGSAGMMIFKDPETGEIGAPSAEQLAEMRLTESDMVAKDNQGVITHNPDGSMTLDLQGAGQDYTVIRRLADGTIVAGCTRHPGEAEHTHLTPTELEEK